MAFTPQNDLEKALVRAAHDPSAAADFWRLLLETPLLAIGTAEGHEAAQQPFSLAPGGNLKLETGEADGRKFLPLFTSIPRMQAWAKRECRYLAIAGRDLLETTRGAPVVLNPGSEYGRELTPEQVAQLLGPGSRAPRTVIGEAGYPMPLVEALSALFRARPEVAAAWMIQVTFADRAKEPHPLVGIEFKPGQGDMAALAAEIERAAGRAVPGLVFDIQRVDRARPAGMADALLQAPPFYVGGPAPGRPLN